jgi:hypothetical protein
MRRSFSEVIAVSNLHAEIDSPVDIPAMYTRTEVRDVIFLTAIVAVFVGIVLGYGWRYEASKHRAATQIGRKG